MVDEGEEIVENVEDLQADRILAWQDRHIFLIGFLVGILAPGLIGYAWVGGVNGFLGGLIYGGFVRVVFVHHGTFLINSAAHTWENSLILRKTPQEIRRYSLYSRLEKATTTSTIPSKQITVMATNGITGIHQSG